MPPKRSVAKLAKTEPSSTPTFTPLRATLSKRAGAVPPTFATNLAGTW